MKKIQLFDVFNVAFIVLVSIIMLYPFLYIISISLSAPAQALQVTFYPRDITFTPYLFIFNMPSILEGYLNTVLYVVLYTLAALILSTFCAYPLSKNWIPGRSGIMVFIVITMFFNGGLIPTYLLVKELGMINTIGAMVLPGALSTWLMIIMRTFFQSIPLELDEASRVDGASEWKVLVRIYLPLSKPILATMALFYGVAKWNSWFDAAIYLNDKAKYPIQLVLRNLMASSTTSPLNVSDVAAASRSLGITAIDPNSLNYALTVAVILPIIFVYPFVQKYFIKGVMIGSLKG